MSEKKKEYNVTVLSRNTITTYPALNDPVETVLITYIAAGLPPFTVRIPKDKHTEKAEKTLIRASIENRLTKKSEAYTV